MGKFFEIGLYNRTATCRTGDCSHCIRDNHVMSFFCDTHVRFDITYFFLSTSLVNTHLDFVGGQVSGANSIPPIASFFTARS